MALSRWHHLRRRTQGGGGPPGRAADLLTALSDTLGLGRAEDLFPYTALQPTLLLLDNLDSLPDEEKVQLRKALRRLGSEILEELPIPRSMILHHGLAQAEAKEYAFLQADQRKVPLTPEKAMMIVRVVDCHPLLLEQIMDHGA